MVPQNLEIQARSPIRRSRSPSLAFNSGFQERSLLDWLAKPKVTFLLGLCGSGKSYYALHLKYDNPKVEIFQDLLHESAILRLFERLANGGDCIVEELRFCFPHEWKKFVDILTSIAGIEIEWICLEND